MNAKETPTPTSTPQRGYSTRRGFRSSYRNGMSEKLRSRLRKRGRGDSSDDEDICAYFNLTSDLLGKDTGEEWPNVEVPKQKY